MQCKRVSRLCTSMQCALLLLCLTAHAQLVLDPASVVKSFTLLIADVPVNDSFCALTPGLNRVLLGFDALAVNTGAEVVRHWTFNWSYSCYVDRNGSIEINCTSDTLCDDKEQKFFSCAVSGVQAGCKTQVRPMPCQFIDVTGAGRDCILTLDGHAYDLSTLGVDADVFWWRFTFSYSVFGSLALVALARALSS